MATRKQRIQSQYRNISGTRRCRPGYILRVAHTRRIRGKTVRVPPACIKDRGLPGKGVSPGQTPIGNLKKGELTKYGYSAKLTEEERHEALEKALRVYGPLTLYRKLNAVSKLSMRTAPEVSHIFAKDRDWVKKYYGIRARPM
jgi:hypothetical protein